MLAEYKALYKAKLLLLLKEGVKCPMGEVFQDKTKAWPSLERHLWAPTTCQALQWARHTQP